MSTNATVSSPATPTQAATSTPGANSSSTPPPASSSPTPTTVNVPTTTIASPTPATTTATPQSSPAQTSVAAVTNTSSSQASSTSFAATATPTITTTSSFTTQVVTTLSSTDAAGSAVYITTSVPDVVATVFSSSAPSTGSSTSTSSSHTSVIVGAVVGGVAGIAIIVLLIFCIRRRAHKDEFDGNFDPDRVVGHTDTRGGTLPRVDFADEVTPFPQSSSYTNQGSSSMRQYGDSKYLAISSPPAASGQTSAEFYTPGAGTSGDAQPRPFMSPGAGPVPSGAYLPPVNMYGTGPVDWHTPHPGVSPPPSTVSNNTSSTRAAKEREALERSGQASGMALATQQEVVEDSGDVVVHQDAGRAPVESHAVPPREIPPAYESIPQD